MNILKLRSFGMSDKIVNSVKFHLTEKGTETRIHLQISTSKSIIRNQHFSVVLL